MHRLLAATSIGVLLLGLGVAMPAVAQAATGKVEVSNCGELSAKPTGIVLACADANMALETLKWTTWNSKTAKGNGVYSFNDCEPTCVAGHFHRYQVDVTLSKPKIVKGTKVFTKARVTFPGVTDQTNKTFNLG
jgi:hypothetical protein